MVDMINQRKKVAFEFQTQNKCYHQPESLIMTVLLEKSRLSNFPLGICNFFQLN